MAEQIKFVSAERLGYYDQLIKKYITDADTAVNDALQAKIDAVNAAVTAEETARKAADVTLNTDIEAAQAAADKAQGEVDALETYVGTIPTDATATDVIGYIQEKTSGIATESALAELQAAMTQAQKDIDAIEADYLVEADKTELKGLIDAAKEVADGAQADVDALAETHSTDKAALEAKDAELAAAITAEQERAEGVESGFNGRIETMEAFWAAAQADGTDSNVIDTLKEIQDYIASDETGAADMLAAIQANEKAIEDMDAAYKAADVTLQNNINNLSATVDTKAAASDVESLEGRMDTAEADIESLEGRMDTAEADIDALQLMFSDGEGSVSDQISDAVADEAALREQGDTDVANAASADATVKANQALADAKEYANGLNNAMEARMGVVEAKAHEHSNKALLDTYTQTEDDLADAVAKKHEHSNLEVLEGITAAKVTAWDDAEANYKSYADGLNSAMDTRVTALEEWHENFEEVSEEEISAMFTA